MTPHHKASLVATAIIADGRKAAESQPERFRDSYLVGWIQGELEDALSVILASDDSTCADYADSMARMYLPDPPAKNPDAEYELATEQEIIATTNPPQP